MEQSLLQHALARALWTGSLSFGLVTIPVEIHTAVKETGPRFRMLRKKDKPPVQFQRVAERDGEVVEWEQIVKTKRADTAKTRKPQAGRNPARKKGKTKEKAA